MISDKPRYQIDKKKWGVATLAELYEEVAMPWDWQAELRDLAKQLGVGFFSTPFDKTAVNFLMDIGVDAMKVASPEIVDTPLVEYVMQQNLPTILSTGGATKSDIALVVDELTDEQREKLCILHCIAEYPVSSSDANLATLNHLSSEFSVKVGLSDHSIGTQTAYGATILGARLVEKHITLDRKNGGIDSHFSSEPNEFQQVKEAMLEAHALLGHSLLEARLENEKDVINSRRSLVALKDIKVGEIFTVDNIASRRPGGGLSPSYLNKILGKRSNSFVEFASPIQASDVDFKS